MIEFVVVLLGRTACGKTTLARVLADRLLLPYASVGQLIRQKAEQSPHLMDHYKREDIFDDEFILNLVRNEVGRCTANSLVIEGSFGLPESLRNLHNENQIGKILGIIVECPIEIRVERFRKRLETSERNEDLSFFYGRENLFDKYFDRSQAVLRQLGPVLDLNGIDNAEDSARRILSWLSHTASPSGQKTHVSGRE